MRNKESGLTFPVRLMILGMLLMLYQIGPMLGWVGMTAVTMYVGMCFFRRAQRTCPVAVWVDHT